MRVIRQSTLPKSPRDKNEKRKPHNVYERLSRTSTISFENKVVSPIKSRQHNHLYHYQEALTVSPSRSSLLPPIFKTLSPLRDLQRPSKHSHPIQRQETPITNLQRPIIQRRLTPIISKTKDKADSQDLRHHHQQHLQQYQHKYQERHQQRYQQKYQHQLEQQHRQHEQQRHQNEQQQHQHEQQQYQSEQQKHRREEHQLEEHQHEEHQHEEHQLEEHEEYAHEEHEEYEHEEHEEYEHKEHEQYQLEKLQHEHEHGQRHEYEQHEQYEHEREQHEQHEHEHEREQHEQYEHEREQHEHEHEREQHEHEREQQEYEREQHQYEIEQQQTRKHQKQKEEQQSIERVPAEESRSSLFVNESSTLKTLPSKPQYIHHNRNINSLSSANQKQNLQPKGVAADHTAKYSFQNLVKRAKEIKRRVLSLKAELRNALPQEKPPSPEAMASINIEETLLQAREVLKASRLKRKMSQAKLASKRQRVRN